MFNTATNGILPTIDLNGNNNDGGMWNSGAWWIIVIIALLWGGYGFGGGLGGFGGGFGGNGIYGGTSPIMSTFDTDYLAQGLRDIQSGLASNFLTLNNENLSGVCDIRGDIASSQAAVTNALNTGFAAQTLASVNNTNAIQRDIFSNTVGNMQNTQALTSQLAQMASDDRADTATLNYNLSSQMCQTNTNNANNTRDIISAIESSNRAVLDAMAQNKVEAMQDKINDLQAQLTNANLLASQAAQNNTLIDALAPKAPIPSYTVPNPYCNCGYRYGNMVNA